MFQSWWTIPARGTWWLLHQMGRWAQFAGDQEMKHWATTEAPDWENFYRSE